MALHHNAIKCLRVAVLWSLKQVCHGSEWPAWGYTNHQMGIEPYEAGCHSRAPSLSAIKRDDHDESFRVKYSGLAQAHAHLLTSGVNCCITGGPHGTYLSTPVGNLNAKVGRYYQKLRSNASLYCVQSLTLVQEKGEPCRNCRLVTFLVVHREIHPDQ